MVHLITELEPFILADPLMLDGPAVTIVWFKRDFRLEDHPPLARAASNGQVIPLWVIEPDWWRSPEMDRSHFLFAMQSALELRERLQAMGGDLMIRVGEMKTILEELSSKFLLKELVSHEETGSWWTYQRDRQVAKWCKEHRVPWVEFRQDGVVRRLASRDRWAGHWHRWVSEPLVQPPTRIELPEGFQRGDDPMAFADKMHGQPATDLQPGGASHAHQLLNTFLSTRGIHYRTQISSPITAQHGCSRLSPYFAWGCITVRQAYQQLEQMRWNQPPHAVQDHSSWGKSLNSFRSRLAWHCHFMQKLEDEPQLEFHNMCRAYDGLREAAFDEARFAAWCEGKTGYPMIDACMRYLRQHRWINFRMRAMLVSFASYDLWLHWQRPAQFLAKHFLDFEPGIHYPQIQMQSGVTGINTLRIYSPEKQGREQDPTGQFVRRYLPELSQVPDEFLWSPSKMSLDDQARYGCRLGVDYPFPIVDHAAAVRQAKEQIARVRRDPQTQEGLRAIAAKHASRRRRDPLPIKPPIPSDLPTHTASQSPTPSARKPNRRSGRSTRPPESDRQSWLPGMDPDR
jgi:deoxyribodipyrimidine photo-lyase